MSEQVAKQTGRAFWILGTVFFLWGLMGCAGYLIEVTMSHETYVDTYGEAMAAIRETNPSWTVALYALAVWTGLIAAILLLLRRKLCAPIFVISFVAAVGSFYWYLTNADARAASGEAFWVMPLVVCVIGLIEIWWSRRKTVDGTLR